MKADLHDYLYQGYLSNEQASRRAFADPGAGGPLSTSCRPNEAASTGALSVLARYPRMDIALSLLLMNNDDEEDGAEEELAQGRRTP